LARKILLADDSVTAQNMGRKILADAGYEVIAVNNGSAALKKIAELKPDLVILDVYMPGYSGLEVCQRLKESPETARIPVLLTVGKLEPFKPEEAQRVRAEGFIVKPFEASELLSTLSKLEDKVVPRAEPSKPGRFARAIAAAEESGRTGRNEPSSDETGWKSRIGFPKQKTEPEETAADEVPAGEKPAAAKATNKQEETRQPVGAAAETSVDVAAMAPAGLPKDVTPEEVAAIAAAAAQIQMAGAAMKDQRPVSEIPSPERVEENLAARPDVHSDLSAQASLEAKTEAPAERNEESRIENVAREAVAAESDQSRKGNESSEETRDLPVTMAATAETVVAARADASRWTAVSVALGSEEAAISLDQEMQKAYAAPAPPQVEPAPTRSSSSPAEMAADVTVAAIANPQPEPVPEAARATSAAAAEAGPAPVMHSEAAAAVASSFAAAEAVHPPAEVQAAATSPTVEFAEKNQGPAVAEVASSAAAPEVEHATELVPSKPDSEAVKQTAAAWASWRQTRDTGKEPEVAEARPKEFEAPQPAPDGTAARAVAAGAEQILQEASAAAPNGEPSNVASIVDSVLADLRPKLMEEISRKMSEKK
jgi:CheY-like chemotaxis protein